MKTIAVLVKVVEIPIFDEGALDLVGGLVALECYPVADPAHLKLTDRGSLAGVDVLGRQHDV